MERWNDGTMERCGELVDCRSSWHLAVLKPLQPWSSSLSDVENWIASLCANFLFFLELWVVVFIICPGCGSPGLLCYLRGYGGDAVLCRLLPLQLLVRAPNQTPTSLPTTSRPHLQNAICTTCTSSTEKKSP